MSNDPDYKMYSIEDLFDAYNHIDRERFPARVRLIEQELEKRNIKADKFDEFEIEPPIHAGEIKSKKHLIKKSSLRLELTNGNMIENPTQKDIVSILSALDHRKHPFVKLKENNLKYMQANIHLFGYYSLEYQNGSIHEHYVCKVFPLSLDTIKDILEDYMYEGSAWRAKLEWEKVEYVPPPSAEVAVLLNRVQYILLMITFLPFGLFRLYDSFSEHAISNRLVSYFGYENFIYTITALLLFFAYLDRKKIRYLYQIHETISTKLFLRLIFTIGLVVLSVLMLIGKVNL